MRRISLRKGIRKVLVFGIVLVLIFVVFAGMPMNVSAEESGDPESQQESPELWNIEESNWFIEGNGTHFKITNSSYLNITLISSENVYIFLESVPKLVSFIIESDCTTNSTSITITGFEINKTYYRYQDGDLQENFTTSEEGSYSYSQNISTNHHIYIQETKSTIYIRANGDIEPTSAPITRNGEIYSLTDNVYESIYIERSGITLDGAGYTVQGPGSGYGIYFQGRYNPIIDVTIKNVKVEKFTHGIWFESSGSVIVDNTLVDITSTAITLSGCDSCTIKDNTITGDVVDIIIRSSKNIKLEGNILNNGGIIINGNKIEYYNTHTIDITNKVNNKPIYYWKNAVSGTIPSGAGQVILANCQNVLVENQELNYCYRGITLGFSTGNTIKGNILLGQYNEGEGIYLRKSPSNTIINNLVSKSKYGIIILDSDESIVNYNTISAYYHGIQISGSSPDNTIIGNEVSVRGHGIDVYSYGEHAITSNTVAAGDYGIVVAPKSNGFAIVSDNTVSGSYYGAIRFHYSNGGTIIDNTVTRGRDGIIQLLNSNDVKIIDNIISQGTLGVQVKSCNGVTINRNIIEDSGTGIQITSSVTTTIFHNNIIDNTIQAYDEDPSNNDWHHPELLEGNYWSDYEGVDDGSGLAKHAIAGDRIGDTLIPHPTTDYDFYPFTEPDVWLNQPPEIDSITGPIDPIPVDTSFVVEGTFTDPDSGDTHTALWDWGDESTSTGTVNEFEGKVTGSHKYTTAGVYIITLTVEDAAEESDTETYEQYVVIYDPTGAFITGGGQFDSPAGAYREDLFLTGKAGFGFVSKYQKGKSTPGGNTQFRFHAGDLSFKSESYDWLVVAGHKGMFKGTGTINGEGNYGFIISAIDEELTPSTDVDLFRIKIWDKNDNDKLIYDNNFGNDDDANPATALTHGSIKIHKP